MVVFHGILRIGSKMPAQLVSGHRLGTFFANFYYTTHLKKLIAYSKFMALTIK